MTEPASKLTSKFKYIDVHAHVNFPDYKDDREATISRAHENGVAIINVGTTLESSRDVLALAQKYDKGVYSIVGMHPVHIKYEKNADTGPDTDMADTLAVSMEKDPYSHDYSEHFDEVEFEKLIADPKTVAVGECGIDIFRLPPELDNETDRAALLALQEKVFRRQIALAAKYDKPIMIHARESYKKILEILDEEFRIHGVLLRGNAHFFAGTVEEARAFLDRGFTVSFTGVITFAKQYEELVRYVPLDKMLSETDCPFVAPVPHRGKRNEPLFVKQVVAKIAEIKGLPEETVRETLLQNAIRQFKLDL